MSDIINKVKDFACKYDLICILKNAVSVISDGNDVFINTTGNSALAKAGSGDVLSGVIAGVTARNDNVLGAAVSSCYIFGLAAEIAVKKQNEYVVTATDVIGSLGDAINSVVQF